MTLRSLLSAAALLAALTLSTVARAETATDTVKAANTTLRDAIKKMVAAKGGAYDKARADARKAVGDLIDFDQVAQATLGKHWAELKPAERTRYIEAVRGAMEASYLTKMQGKLAVDDVKVEYLGEEPKGENTLVKTRFTYGQDALNLGFVIAKGAKGKKAHAVDVFTEDVSLVDSYKDQINSLWAKKKFEGVVGAFEKKKKQLEAQLKEQTEKPAEQK
ncbi:MAG: ABC transporter substrate-binding protein [Deltaproteobacteria bacterium]|nr:ABC transporter substrate-binding protein [Deltaproteobacteria bacterium]